MAVIILAGGRSVRFGRCKATEPLAGETLLSRVIRVVSPLDRQVIVAVGTGTEIRLPGYPGIRSVADVYPGCGPLAGIHSGLLESDSDHSLVVACDMPFLNRPLLRHLLDVAPGYDAVVPRIGGRLEPLHAVYSKACLPHLERLLAEGKHSLYDLMPRVPVRYVDSDDLDRFDARHSFFNLNTQGDLARAAGLVGTRRAASHSAG